MSTHQVEKKIRNDTYNALIFKLAGRKEIYLVGGYIRNAFRGIDSPDRDYIFRGKIIDFVKQIQKLTNGTIVEFKKKQTIRLILSNHYTFDFSQLKGQLKRNLSKRDFTLNSMAWSPETGIIDFENGISDLCDGIVRCISFKNMIDDPVRMMRAYRFAAEINGKVDDSTRETIKRYHKRIITATSERITLELFHLLNTNNSSRELMNALNDKILPLVLSCSEKTLFSNIKAIHELENELLYHIPDYIKAKLQTLFSQNLTFKGLLCLETLQLNNQGQRIMSTLTLSKKIRKRLSAVSAGIQKLMKLKEIERHHLFKLFQISGDAASDIIILSGKLNYLRDLEIYRKITEKNIISANALTDTFGIKSGPQIGKMIQLLKEAQFLGFVKSRKDAIDFINKNLMENNLT